MSPWWRLTARPLLRLPVGARETTQRAWEHRGSKGARRNRIGPCGTSEYSGRVLMAMALRARALRPCAQCASSHAAMASPLSAVNRLPIAPWPVGSDARWAHATRHAATVHPGFLTRAKGGKAGTVERAHLPACIFNSAVTSRTEPYRQVASRRALTQVRPPARARIAKPTHLCSMSTEMQCRVEVGISFGRRRVGRGL